MPKEQVLILYAQARSILNTSIMVTDHPCKQACDACDVSALTGRFVCFRCVTTVQQSTALLKRELSQHEDK